MKAIECLKRRLNGLKTCYIENEVKANELFKELIDTRSYMDSLQTEINEIKIAIEKLESLE